MGNKNDAFYIPEKDSAWCYTTDPGTTWEYCDIRDCTPCDQGQGTFKYYTNNLAPLKVGLEKTTLEIQYENSKDRH